jgi:PAS domain S-box-containing protein
MPRRAGNTDWASRVNAILKHAPKSALARGSLGAQVRLLALLGSAAPLTVLLEGLATYVETWAEGLYCSVLLTDPTGRLLQSGAAPSLPAEYIAAIDPVLIAVGQGSCGTAAALCETVVVEDVERSELWRDYASIAVAHGLRACWSVPVHADTRELLGTLAVYSGIPRKPTGQEVDLIQFAASLAAFVIQRHRDDDRLHTSEARLRAAVVGADIGLWDCDPRDGGVWFDDWCQRLDIEPCDGANWEVQWIAQIHPDDLERYKLSDRECLLGNADQYVNEYRVRTRAGGWRWLYERGSVAARDAAGSPLHYVGVCIDIEDRKTAELALRQSDERFRTFARLVQGYVFEARLQADYSVEFTWADDAFTELFGCERAEVNRRGWHSFVDPRDRAAAAKCLAAIAAGANAHIELRIAGANGKRRWLRMAGEPVRDLQTRAVTGFIGMAEDITDRKELMEQMFASVNREQRRIGNDLHDELGQVLTGASLLLRGCHTSASRGDAVTPGEIERVLELLAGAIENTRSLAHGLAPGMLDCGGLTSALENLAAQARRWSGLEIILASNPGDLGNLDAATSDHLYRIVQEAITNVARHANAQRAEIATRIEDGALIIEVSDDGIGIPASVTNGFGLRTMRYRADAIGAEFAIDVTRPYGTRLSVRLPSVSAAAAAAVVS